ncbi:MAG TPA: S41 family peptidase [Salegentibacter sp.]|uniref:S41 family peptidase n=1 Tax=Salegentibacter sp. TaxID=1903072 RepID=UPI002F9265CB
MRFQISLLFSFLSIFLISCEKEEEELINSLAETREETGTQASTELEVEQFVYRGMNDIYLYKEQVPSLANNYFASKAERDDYLAGFNDPENLFDALTYSQDRFSFITDDYKALEERFDGVSSSTAGMDFGLGRISNSNNVFGYIRYVIPGTSADTENLERGMIFTEVNGQALTVNNYSSLLEANTMEINIGKIEDGKLILSDKTVQLSRTEYTENPVHKNKVLNIGGKNIAYLMYNSFTGNFDTQLNAAFAEFKTGAVDELILDLRYNGGGSVQSAIDLASMITGQFEGEIFLKEQWNKKYQESFEANDPERLLNRFDTKIRTGEAINSLNLSRVYVLTSRSTASASELIINGLEPYIDVVQVGDQTTGKFQASVTLYDSPDFGRSNANKNHTYAMQPLVFKSANANGKTDYINGLKPDIEYVENPGNLGELGDPKEALLANALNHIFGKAPLKGSVEERKAAEKFKTIGESGMNDINYQRMYIESLPELMN